MKIAPRNLPAAFDFNKDAVATPQAASLAPNQIPPKGWIQTTAAITEAELADVTSVTGSSYLYGYGTARYRDIFNQKDVTDFCWFLDPKSVKKDAAGNITPDFIWAICAQHTGFK
jgi:hypothetical protein